MPLAQGLRTDLVDLISGEATTQEIGGIVGLKGQALRQQGERLVALLNRQPGYGWFRDEGGLNRLNRGVAVFRRGEGVPAVGTLEQGPAPAISAQDGFLQAQQIALVRAQA